MPTHVLLPGRHFATKLFFRTDKQLHDVRIKYRGVEKQVVVPKLGKYGL